MSVSLNSAVLRGRQPYRANGQQTWYCGIETAIDCWSTNKFTKGLNSSEPYLYLLNCCIYICEVFYDPLGNLLQRFYAAVKFPLSVMGALLSLGVIT